MVVTMATTIASRGRSTKMADNMGSASAQCGGKRRSHFSTRTHKQQALDDDQLPTLKALVDHHTGIGLAARLHPLDRSFAILDGEQVDTLLVGNERGLRHHHFCFRLPVFDFDANELSVDKLAVGVRECGARQDRVGATIDLNIDKVDSAFLLIPLAVSKAK